MNRSRVSLLRWIFVALVASAPAIFASPALAVPNFTLESGNRLADASPQSITGSFATSLRMYFIRDFQVLSATSTDGLAWTEESGVRLSSESFNGAAVAFSSVTSASVLELDGGGFRMLCSVATSTNAFRVISASSADGLNWGLENDKFYFPANAFGGSVRIVEETDGDWRMFFVAGSGVGFSSSTYRIFRALSEDQGVTWGPATQVLDEQAHDVAPAVLSDNRVRLYYTAPLTSGTTATQVLSAIGSNSADTFRRESGVRASTGAASGTISSPLVFRASESFRWRLYTAFVASVTASVPVVASYRTETPDPQRLSPSTVARTIPNPTFTVGGEIFSPGLTAKLTKAGETDIPATAVVVNSDLSATMAFDTQSRALGQWDLTIVNSDAQSATLANALTIDFEAGQVAPLDNVFRPLRGQSVHFDVTIFDAGRIVARLYTLEGRLVRTLFDGTAPLGTTGIDWNGRTEDGEPVASGVYVVDFEGPKLDAREKVVVIK